MPALLFEPFQAAEFDLYRPAARRDEAFNPQRLRVRRKLKAIGERAKRALKAEGQVFELRESLHHPHAFNHRSVVAQWVYLTRTAAEKRAFKSLFGDVLGKDVDPAHANLYLAVSADADGLAVALRIHPEAWYDGLNLKNKVAAQGRVEEWVELLTGAEAGVGTGAGERFELAIEGWRRSYPLSAARRDEQRALFDLYKPGEHRLMIARRIPRDDPLALSAELPEQVLADLRALVPLYRWIAWSQDNAFLQFGGA